MNHIPEKRRLAVIGAGAIGDPVQIPWLIEYMHIPEFARAVGEAFSMYTGRSRLQRARRRVARGI